MSFKSSEFVCDKCFNDEDIQGYVQGMAEKKKCDFCGRVSKAPIAAPLGDVAEYIAERICSYYDDPANAGLPYESAEGGYQGVTYITLEVFDEMGLDFPRKGGERLRDELAERMPHELWSDAEPFRLSEHERLRFSWESFCDLIKHKLRYFFAQKARDEDDEILTPSQILRLIFSYAEDVNAFITLPKGTPLFRARHQAKGETFATAGTLGPPPVEVAVQTNRMSPPGIVMTYVADDRETALAETASAPGTFAIGEFTTERDAVILDLTHLPQAPGIFAQIPESMEYDPRPRLIFLRMLSEEISRPIARDNRIHIEYVPTQVITEYLRTAVEVDGKKVDGIRYRSSRKNAGTAIVLFADRDHVVFEEGERPEYYHFAKDRWLKLKSVQVKNVTQALMAKWS
ncbi:hypothetical protein AOQ72_03865 [Bradyrhizobium yuanmingense]|uniref:RES domain-containing protein n=2 Tax=Bradyrhizobium yuanmingense TaxID=108015 RepID=A0A0R3BRN3_9BRAD|nr:hypothetical protein AOQ72_03865 [Bradyrhizobium yuanmingense]